MPHLHGQLGGHKAHHSLLVGLPGKALAHAARDAAGVGGGRAQQRGQAERRNGRIDDEQVVVQEEVVVALHAERSE